MGHRMTEQEIIDQFDEALESDQIYALYQPQINHSTGRMIGAEALMRWEHPEHGMQFPADFIPVLEKNDLIYRADLHIFELVCRLQKKCLADGSAVVPISFNMSRYDIYHHDYVESIEDVRRKYDIPVKYLRVEITETSAIGGMELVSDVLNRLHRYGYIVEMDDFGSGYSSLNILKDLPVDMIKLDMSFLSGDIGGRGGTIVSSMVQMSKWLDTPMIAEGVETMEQADYMKSVGCDYIQGYLYSKPVPEKEFLSKLASLEHEPVSPAMLLLDTMNSGKFWDPYSMETLIFSNFVAAACIFLYEEGEVEILRVNSKYVREIGMNMTEREIIGSNPWLNHDDESHRIYEEAMLRAIESGEEETCETWRRFRSKSCGEDSVCIRSDIRVIGKAGRQYLFYAMVQNVTAQKKNYLALEESEHKFRVASEHTKSFAWEYTIATKEMRPCARCIRELGLPPIVKNYPEPVIESGLFPADVADMYRDWHRQLELGVDHLEAVIPLTADRIPFRVQYTNEYDETGRPLKAYGSATPVENSEPEQDCCKVK